MRKSPLTNQTYSGKLRSALSILLQCMRLGAIDWSKIPPVVRTQIESYANIRLGRRGADTIVVITTEEHKLLEWCNDKKIAHLRDITDSATLNSCVYKGLLRIETDGSAKDPQWTVVLTPIAGAFLRNRCKED